jgi:hypothetical protein
MLFRLSLNPRRIPPVAPLPADLLEVKNVLDQERTDMERQGLFANPYGDLTGGVGAGGYPGPPPPPGGHGGWGAPPPPAPGGYDPGRTAGMGRPPPPRGAPNVDYGDL